MKTKKQEELVGSFLSALGDETRPVYKEIITCLSELGYSPQKEKSSIAFKHDAHHKQIAKMKPDKGGASFALRFSACRGYSQRFADIIAAWVAKYPTRAARCPSDGCNFCAGDPGTHVYTHASLDGECTHCGAYALTVPNLSAADLPELRKLIAEEHAYLMKHEAGR